MNSNLFSWKGYEFEGVSEGGIKTSIMCPRLNLMFDIGTLDADKSHIGNVLLTHGHLDHSALLPYYISQRSLRKLPGPNIYVHEELGHAMDKILAIYSEIEGFDYKYNMNIVKPGDRIELNKNTFFKPVQTFHRVPSLGYTVYETHDKLKPEYKDLHRDEIVRLKMTGTNLVEAHDYPVISFSGDTKIEYVLENEDVRNSKILFLECTYLDQERDVARAREWGHIHLDEIIHYAEEFKNEKLVLIHFSKRYTRKTIRELIAKKVPDKLKERIYTFI